VMTLVETMSWSESEIPTFGPAGGAKIWAIACWTGARHSDTKTNQISSWCNICLQPPG
jgi:hypothetical protein